MPSTFAITSRVSAGVVGVVFGFLAGCAETKPPTLRLPAPTPRTVNWSGGRLHLGDADSAALPSQFVLQQAQLQVDAHLPQGIERLVRLYPDLVVDVLRHTNENSAKQPVYTLLAAAYDAWEQDLAKSTGPTAGTWRDIADIRSRNPERLRAFDQNHAAFERMLENGQFRSASQIQLSAGLESPEFVCLRAEAIRLEGIALLLDNQPAPAAAHFNQAVAILVSAHPHAAAEMGLLAAEALRRSDQHTAAAEAWSRAATAAPLNDPALWDRAIITKPAAAAWPPDAIDRIAGTAPATTTVSAATSQLQISPPTDAAQEGLVWRHIADRRLARGESQSALLCYARAAAQAGTSEIQASCKIGQARALAALGQNPPACALLFDLVVQQDPTIAKPAMALLGSIRVQQGQVPQGVRLLRRSLDDNPTVQWPRREDAEADLGLALLMTDQESEGLTWLHQAQAEFEKQKHWESATRSLLNESAYFKQKGNAAAASGLLDKARDLANANGLIIPAQQ